MSADTKFKPRCLDSSAIGERTVQQIWLEFPDYNIRVK
jgi:hypothetical protein